MSRLKKIAEWINYDNGDQRVVQLLNDAIQYQNKIKIEYKTPGYWITISPFALNNSKDGNTTIKAYVYSDSMESDDNGLNVKSYRVDSILNVTPCPNDETDKGKYNQNYDAANEYDDLQNKYDKNYGTDKYIANIEDNIKRLKNN